MEDGDLHHQYPGPWFNMKKLSYQYRKSNCGDKTILRPSYLHNEISYTGKTTSLYWIKALVADDLATLGARASAAMLLIEFSHNILTSVPKVLIIIKEWRFIQGSADAICKFNNMGWKWMKKEMIEYTDIFLSPAKMHSQTIVRGMILGIWRTWKVQ